ncbi:phosphatidylserine/phosphatidylglycerophosphate/cardiolipin synthase family protein [Idiomarina piscisalsi]|uniref:Phospholipase n=1 Tax=Idiomarina piscisalsi TaxID=1096243 RepID=A0ABM6LT43_9GAMM|nr:phospholipase D family protein [Idiomarina piscisalsi]ASG65636.1 phospholipase [Idiomarina piscisalsi]MTJ02828.1 phospholipase D family protein [Idiomarina piscisalsi]
MTPKVNVAQVSQFQLLSDAHQALIERVKLLRSAKQHIAMQYYLWRPDTSGLTLLKELLNAVERGVTVDLLLDDHHSRPIEPLLRDLSRRSNFNVKFFNPFRHRRWRWVNWLTDFKRMNRRMHNKALVIDQQIAIVGGRNVGDEYFGTHAGQLFSDLDVIVRGPVVTKVLEDWRHYWQCALSKSVGLIKRSHRSRLFEEIWKVFESKPETQDLNKYVLSDEQLNDETKALPEFSASAQVVSDDPLKADLASKPKRSLTQQIAKTIGSATQSILLVSPYFVPTATGVKELESLAEQGVEVRVLTNSLAVTDVPAVHAGYQRRRRRLLLAGIKLFELRLTEEKKLRKDMKPYFRRSASSLHAKTVTVDGSKVFVGSFNFDPRSAQINTESGIIIESVAMAQRINSMFDHELPMRAYEARLNRFYKLYWLDKSQIPAQKLYKEPGAGIGRRLTVWLTARLPVDHLL